MSYPVFLCVPRVADLKRVTCNSCLPFGMLELPIRIYS